jgi:hypothetical protein
MARCACGAEASWDKPVFGLAGGSNGEHRVVWPACKYHPERAIGRPVPANVYRRGKAAIEAYEAKREREEG